MDLTNKSAADLRTMLANATRAGDLPGATAQRRAAATAMHEAAEAELARRGPVVRARGPLRPAAPDAALLAAAVERLVAVAARAQAEYDLSAARVAPGTGKPHALLGKDGKPKLGGRARDGRARRDLYISYRSGDRIAAFAFLLRDKDDAEGVWEGGLVLPGKNDPSPEAYAGPDPDQAEAAFMALLGELAPRHG